MTGRNHTVFCFFRESPDRKRYLNAEPGAYRSYLFQGTERYGDFGWQPKCNLHRPPFLLVRYCGDSLSRWMFRFRGYGGDFGTLFMNLRLANNADVVYSTVDTVGIPLALCRYLHLLRKPLVYMSIGLCERLDNMADSFMKRRLINSLRTCSVVAGYGWEEVERLKTILGPQTSVHFVPYGVDTEKWRPLEVEKTVDVLSLGVDPQRDFLQLRLFAERNPGRSLRIITSNNRHKALKRAFPPNVILSDLLPLDEVFQAIASARVIALPVKDNTYSGATTTLLQCMAMGLPVVVSHVGAIKGGYDLIDRQNCRLVEPNDASMWADVLKEMLNQPGQCVQIGRAARRHVQGKFTQECYLKNIIYLFNFAANKG